MLALSLSFFVTAILYAAVGFGGGSTYSALLVLAETDYRVLPIISLLCNLIVVSGGVWRFWRGGHIDFKSILPWISISVPAAYLGGMIKISEDAFILVLGVTLLLSGIKMLLPARKTKLLAIYSWSIIPYIIGGALGFIAGIVGIGGGIFLAPVLYFIKWRNAKSIAGACSVFIFLNSLAGLVGQISKFGSSDFMGSIGVYWLVFPAVFIGGQIGSYGGAIKLNAKSVNYMTALLILYVAIRLLLRFIYSN